ncbi:T9SS type A sorting domain-containing protein [Psychroserpens ponticola]|uniref:T9SS type A sorting domain-containing protein n=1 Tax=Psychroserpens ponticola TaxID=2932268 RepID=A0ABY7RT22_9FLAO|nr:T9SS type A sorting domain-containing protein [Psychroserpens ponticola]WCO00266.1 T9SS type A sorting domain-containing protein [Psychroserpens ponticola]
MNKLFLILFFIVQFLNSQNLVPNGSFENYFECPEIQGDFNVDNWYNVLNHSGTADFFHTCSTGSYSIPTSFFGTQIPRDGNAFTGFACFNNLSFELREYLQVELVSPLIANRFYEISFYVSLADNRSFALNHIGALLTNFAVEGDNTLNHLSVEPQILSNDIISDKENWTKVSGIIESDGGESFLTIGVFSSDEEISIMELPDGEPLSYYFLDSVSIIETEENNSEQNCLTILNPVQEFIYLNSTIDINSLDAILYDISGKRIKKKIVENEIYVGDLSDGVYIMHYKCGTKTDYKKIIKI